MQFNRYCSTWRVFDLRKCFSIWYWIVIDSIFRTLKRAFHWFGIGCDFIHTMDSCILKIEKNCWAENVRKVKPSDLLKRDTRVPRMPPPPPPLSSITVGVCYRGSAWSFPLLLPQDGQHVFQMVRNVCWFHRDLLICWKKHQATLNFVVQCILVTILILSRLEMNHVSPVGISVL